MPEIVLTDEQAKQLAGAVVPVEVKDAAGRVVGHLEPVLPPEFIAELKRRAATPGPRYSGTQVVADRRRTFLPSATLRFECTRRHSFRRSMRLSRAHLHRWVAS